MWQGGRLRSCRCCLALMEVIELLLHEALLELLELLLELQLLLLLLETAQLLLLLSQPVLLMLPRRRCGRPIGRPRSKRLFECMRRRRLPRGASLGRRREGKGYGSASGRRDTERDTACSRGTSRDGAPSYPRAWMAWGLRGARHSAMLLGARNAGCVLLKDNLRDTATQSAARFGRASGTCTGSLGALYR